MRVGILHNPNSRKNRRLRESGQEASRLEQLEKRLGRLGRIVRTEELGELKEAISKLLDEGVEYLVCDGGDGALHCVLNEVRTQRGDSGLVPLVPTRGGTIDFVARKVGIQGSQDTIVERLLKRLERGDKPEVIWLDSLRVQGVLADEFKGVGQSGAPQGGSSTGPATENLDCLGFAMAAGGVGQRFFDQYYTAPDPSPKTIVNIALRAIASHGAARLNLPRSEALKEYSERLFQPTAAEVFIDGERLSTTEHRAIHAGAFDVSLGGVFRVFPLAAEPGKLHFQAGAITPKEIVAAVPALVRGNAISSEHLKEVAGTQMKIVALQDALNPILDGEHYCNFQELNISAGPLVPIARV